MNESRIDVESASDRQLPLVMVVYGTRPEAIKSAPLVLELGKRGRVKVSVVTTGQHLQILDQVNELFGILPNHRLNIFSPGQSIQSIVAKTLLTLSPILESERPDAVVVHGDTSTANAAAQAAFYCGIPVVHLEAGLRTRNLTSPFPEEANRQMISRLAALHLAPTCRNKQALVAEGISPELISVTGNTVIDALHHALARIAKCEPMSTDRQRILVTLHRRENLGQPMEGVARAILRIAREFREVTFIVPMHPNPAVRLTVMPFLKLSPNITILEPLDYLEFVRELAQCGLVVTDSGGLQEEGPGLGKPVLVVRNTTERPEGVDSGTVRLIGTNEDEVYHTISLLLRNCHVYERMASAVNPYGDGRAAGRCAAAIESLFGIGPREPDFVPAPEKIVSSLV